MTDPVSVSGPDIETLLAAHVGKVDFDRVACWPCGERFESWAAHRAHVAAVLRAHIVTAQAEAWEAAVEHLATVGYFESGHHNNPYRAALVGQIGADHD